MQAEADRWTAAPRSRPSVWWFGLAGILALGSIALGIVVVVTSVVTMLNKIDDFTRFEVPGEETIALSEPGEYTIYHESENVPGDFELDPLGEIELLAPDGSPVPLRRDDDGHFNYPAPGGREGEAVYEFDAEEPGDYTVSADGNDGALAVAIGPGVAGRMMRRIVVGIGIAALGLLLSAVLVIVIAVLRSQPRRQRTSPVPW